MNYNEILQSIINEYPNDEPILIEEIKECLKTKLGDNFNNAMKSIYVYINRMVKAGIIKNEYKGVYYKPTNGIFGEKPLNTNKIIEKKYLYDDKGIKGYIGGAELFNKLGLTTQVPNNTLIITNECPNNNDYKNNKLFVTVRKPKIPITTENYLYLQLIDILINKDNVNIEVENVKEIVYDFINQNDLMMSKIFEYAKKTNNKAAIITLYEMENR